MPRRVGRVQGHHSTPIPSSPPLALGASGNGGLGTGFRVRAAGPPGGPGPSLPAFGPEPCPRCSSNVHGRRHLCPVFLLHCLSVSSIFNLIRSRFV